MEASPGELYPLSSSNHPSLSRLKRLPFRPYPISHLGVSNKNSYKGDQNNVEIRNMGLFWDLTLRGRGGGLSFVILRASEARKHTIWGTDL